ncbi:hypothetical protein KO525_00225 [Psychrosphaera sp. B3R10]|uniref:spermidine synthase n=1 Tax=unclassified Psychrosphaera TaxID=2641570 RepID=UPI001C080BD7|nr:MULTISPECIES: hypothetical protein [unclassified Psychrosphaera]MBU2880372.1 hypothetical protein [Psychrosphaera sp. I2R16]MBU2987811.1 hypothetical protein [Psychrosphaera sp. B3R10]
MKLAQTLTPDNENKTIYMVKSSFGNIEIRQSGRQSWLLVNGIVQTAIENSRPYRSLLPHNYVMLLPLNYDDEPKSILELGGGGLFINRYLSHSRPDIKVTSVDCCAEVIDSVKTYFPASANLTIVETDAIDYLEHLIVKNSTFDWVIVDIFIGDSNKLATAQRSIFAKINQCLNQFGWLVINILDTSEQTIEQLNQGILAEFDETPYRFAVPEMQNQIMMLRKGGDFKFPESVAQHDLNKTSHTFSH